MQSDETVALTRFGDISRAPRRRLFAAVIMAAAIFWTDTFTAMTSAVAVLYVVAMFVAGEALTRRGIVLAALLCALLTLASFTLNHGLHPDNAAVARCVISLAAIAVAAALMVSTRGTHILHRTQAELLDLTQDAVVLREVDGTVLLWNKGAEQLYGWTRGEMIGVNHHQRLQSRMSPSSAEVSAILQRAGTWEGEIEQERKGGGSLTISSRWRLRAGRNGRPDTVLETNTDVTDRRKAIEALTASEWRYRTIFESLGVAILEHDLRELIQHIGDLRAQGVGDFGAYMRANPNFIAHARSLVRITDVNGAGLRLIGVERKEDFFSTLAQFLPEQDESFPRFVKAVADGDQTFEAEGKVLNAAGAVLDIIIIVDIPRDQGGFDRVPGCLLDITERKKMSRALDNAGRELDRAMRMAAVGQVSATIAHEVNQPLSAIRTYADAARRWLSRDPPDMVEVRSALEDVVATSNHAGEVVKRVRRLFGGADRGSVAVVVDEMINGAVQLVGREAVSSGTEIHLMLEAGDASVLGDAVLLQQVVLNLATNAIAAMRTVPESDRLLRISSLRVLDHVEIRVRDSGPGFPEDHGSRVFDAFFTTREDGLGLGLAICRSTVFAHGGSVEIEDGVVGASVLIRLPLL